MNSLGESVLQWPRLRPRRAAPAVWWWQTWGLSEQEPQQQGRIGGVFFSLRDISFVEMSPSWGVRTEGVYWAVRMGPCPGAERGSHCLHTQLRTGGRPPTCPQEESAQKCSSSQPRGSSSSVRPGASRKGAVMGKGPNGRRGPAAGSSCTGSHL